MESVARLAQKAIDAGEWSRAGLAREVGCDVRTITRMLSSGRIGPTYARKLRDLLDPLGVQGPRPLSDEECRQIRELLKWYDAHKHLLPGAPDLPKLTPSRAGPARSRKRQ